MTDTKIVQTNKGPVKGVLNRGKSWIFRGIPYAAPPVGKLRWKAPQQSEIWKTPLDCSKFRCACPQASESSGIYVKEFYEEGMASMDEDCLHLNVWTPAEFEEDGLPVLIYLHGGAFCAGWSFEKTFDGEAYNEKGVILVTVNYRLGVFGFFAHPELSAESESRTSGNYGLLDQIAALHWVKENIRAFGGDPENVTIMGSSAGACCIYDLMCSPLAKGLFHKAILSSGDGIGERGMERTLEEGEKMGQEICCICGANSVEELRGLPADELYEKTAAYMPKTVTLKTPVFPAYVPVVDGFVLPGESRDLLTTVESMDIPCIAGYVSEEVCDYFINSDGTYSVSSWKDSTMRFAEKYGEQKRSPVYLYHFSRKLPGDEAGAFHGAELWYVFHTLDRCWRPFTQEDASLSEEIVSYLSNFARTGSPNDNTLKDWRPYKKSRPHFMIWDIGIEDY